MAAKRLRSLRYTVSRTQSLRLKPSDRASDWMLRNPWRICACGSRTMALVAGSMPGMPARNTKSPALAPRLQVPSALKALGGASVLTPGVATPLGGGAWARLGLDAMTMVMAAAAASAGRCHIVRSPSRDVAIASVSHGPCRRRPARTIVRQGFARRNRKADAAAWHRRGSPASAHQRTEEIMASPAPVARTPGAKRAGAGEYLFDLAKVNKIKGGPSYSSVEGG